MSTTGSISVASGLLGGTAGQIDTTSLINQLMAAQAIPQQHLQDQRKAIAVEQQAYQSITSRVTAVQAAAQALTDPTAWQATAATSSSPAVVATSGIDAAAGSTTFDVTKLARAQVTTVAADSGTVISVPSAGITIKDSSGSHAITLASGSAADVASAINAAHLGVRASVVQTNTGVILQVVSVKSGTDSAFSIEGTDHPPQTAVPAQNAEVSVGDPNSGGYTVTSPTNTFTGVIPGVTFSANALATGVTVSVSSDQTSISDKVSALVTAANAALKEMAADTAKGAVLQGRYDVRSVATALASAVSGGTASGASLKRYGIDLDSTGQLSFDAAAFASAYTADPAATQTAVAGAFGTALQTASNAAVAPVSGTLSAAITAGTSRISHLDDHIDKWTSRLADIKSNLQVKYATMQTALARLQSQQTYLTSMFNNMNKSGSASS